MNDWPFTLPELTAGLRRYFAEPGLVISDLQPGREQTAAGRGLRVVYRSGRALATVACLVREPGEGGRAGLASPGMREVGVYRSLASQLPMATPALVAADPAGNWLVLEAVEGEPVGADAALYDQAVVLLAALHERFWGLAEDLAAYPWLARPLSLDYAIHVYAAAQALGRIVRDEHPPMLAHAPEVLAVLGQVISQAERVAQPLRAVPHTLLHGDYRAGNWLRDADGELIVVNWHMAGIGPGVLDLVSLVAGGVWEHGALPAPAADLVGRYRAEVATRLGVQWPQAEWDALWDHALLWRFLQEMLTWAAESPAATFEARAERFNRAWLMPVLAAARRRLAGVV